MACLNRDPMLNWKGFLQMLRATYAQGDPRLLTRVWTEGRSLPRVGPRVRMVERFYPVGRVLSLAAELDQRIAQDGLSEASHWLLDAWAAGWKSHTPSATAAVLASHPALVYGNHPSLLTPFLVAANTRRTDLKIISASFLERFLPSYAPYAIPVALPTSNWREQFRRGGLSRVLMAMLMHYLQPEFLRETAKDVNRRAVAQAADHIRAGGAVLIAPGGWSVRHWPWHPGIGRILQALASRPGAVPDYLVPFREENSSDARMRAVFGRGPVASVKRKCLLRLPVTIRFSPPQLRSELVPFCEDASAIVRRLQARYTALFRYPERLTGREEQYPPSPQGRSDLDRQVSSTPGTARQPRTPPTR